MPTTPHLLDRLVGLLTRRAKLFSEGWGDEQVLAAFDAPPFAAVPTVAALTWGPVRSTDPEVLDGTFLSPVDRLPAESRRARVRWIRSNGRRQAAILVLTSAGDQGFGLRTRLFGPLAAEGTDVFLLENPFYGGRRPAGQRGAQLRTVSDHGLMNLATIEEARQLLVWLRAEGWGRVGLVGYSMGGFVAAVAASLTPEPLAVAVLAGGASAAAVLTKGFVSRSIDFPALGGAPERGTEARHRLAGLFDKTDLARFPLLRRPQAAILVACERDGFVPPELVEALHRLWQGSELRRIDAGHVSAIFTHAADLRAAVRDSLERLPPPQDG